jgi:hypothetical protein
MSDKKYDVIKMAVLTKSRRASDEKLIFKDLNGRIYIIDNSIEHKVLSTLEIDKAYLIWVTKEYENTGLAKVSICGVSIIDYVVSLPDRDIKDYLGIRETDVNDEMRFTNDMYNHDLAFSLYQNSDDEKTPSDTEIALSEHYDRVGINSELSEYIYEKSVLDSFLVSKIKD